MRCNIEDHKGDGHEYEVAAISPSLDGRRRLRYSRPDADRFYVVTLGVHGPTCTCPDYLCRKKPAGDICKHARHAMEHDTLTIARKYIAGGLSVIPIKGDGSKAPDIDSWEPFMGRLATEEELERWFGNGHLGAVGVAIVGGAVSGGLEIIDVDRDDVWPEWSELVEAERPGLLGGLPRVKTPNGYHVSYRCGVNEGSKKLAKEPAGAGAKTLIETRGVGGYVLAPGCPPLCHPTGGTYELVNGDLGNVPTITPAERACLFTCARALDRMPEEAKPRPQQRQPGDGGGDRPGDDFNRRATWPEILEPTGWVAVRQRGDLTHWRRPGKDHGISATTGLQSQNGNDLLHVFSTNAYPLQEGCYTKFGAFAMLLHQGDMNEAARALLDAGFGDPPITFKLRFTPLAAAGKNPPRPNADTSDDPLDGDATAFDLVCHNSTIRWAWEGWLPLGALTILASEPGVGKTRLCADLARRVAGGLPWPDGSAQSFPADSRTLWVPADNQHPELGTIPAAFGFLPTLLYLNATRRNPFAGTMLDSREDLVDFEARIKRVAPAIVFIDTCLNATDRTSHKPEDAKAFFKPLAEIAQRTQVVMICVTHLNASGKPLGRRIEGQGRVVVMLEQPDPEGQPHRRRLWIKKSHSVMPAPLGVTMGEAGNEYDTNPPEHVQEPGRNGKRDPKAEAAAAWLKERLKAGAQRVSNTRTAAEAAGHTAGSLYRGKDLLGVEEFEAEGRKWWQLASKDRNGE